MPKSKSDLKGQTVHVVYGKSVDGDISCLGVFQSEKEANKLQDDALSPDFKWDTYHEDGVVYVDEMTIE